MLEQAAAGWWRLVEEKREPDEPRRPFVDDLYSQGAVFLPGACADGIRAYRWLFPPLELEWHDCFFGSLVLGFMTPGSRCFANRSRGRARARRRVSGPPPGDRRAVQSAST